MCRLAPGFNLENKGYHTVDIRPTQKEVNPGIFDRALLGGRLAWLKRFTRWFNLTVLQQAVWPLMIVLFSAPQVDIEESPFGWYLTRVAGPLIAATLAALYCSRYLRRFWRGSPAAYQDDDRSAHTSMLATQLRYALLGLPVAVALMRLLVGPADEALKIISFGMINVAAFHLIHFGVVPMFYADRTHGQQVGAVLFGVSWALHDGLLVALSNDGSWLLAMGAGLFLGWVVAAVSLLIRRWPGGSLTAAAAHFLVVYLVFGFV
ncbi:hypothetical protein BH24CHL4_BH24CHL4_21080 [soil metagenome]